jgi:hypothetical protein
MERGWPDTATSLPKDLHTYFEKRMELAVEEEVLLWRGRIVVPAVLQGTMLQLLHEGHPGVCSMRELAKFYAWWPHIDEDINHYVAACGACQQGRPREPEVPLCSWNVPSEPWSRVHLDFAGPFEGFMWLLIIDAYTKWLEVVRMKSTTAAATCGKLREVFARYGVPRTLVSDNGPQWISEEFKQFCTSNSITQVLSTPYHPKTNGLAERAVRTFKERMSATKSTTADLHTRLQKFLLSYRNTPQASTGRPPSELMFGRRLRTRLDLLKPDVRSRIEAANFRQQCDHDRRAMPRSFAAGDPVWIALPSGDGHQPGVILRRTAPLSYVVLVNGSRVRKHADQLRLRRMDGDNRPAGNDEDVDAPSGLVSVPGGPPVVPPVPPVLPVSGTPSAVLAPSAASTSSSSAVLSDASAAASVPSGVASVPSPVVLRRSQRARRFPRDPYAKYL